MHATTVLRDEHRVIECVLASLENAVRRAEAGRALLPRLFLDAADFARHFTDGSHHRKEEQVLFPAMLADDPRGYGGLISAMVADHQQGREYTRALCEALGGLQAGEDEARTAVIDCARNYAELLRAHIHVEENIVFKIADRVLPAADQELIAQGFACVELEEAGTGVHEKYVALAGRLGRLAAV